MSSWKVHICINQNCCCSLVAKSCLVLLWPHGACQALLSMGFSRQEYWRELSFPSPGDLPNPGIEPVSPALAGRFFNHWATWEAHNYGYHSGNEGKSGIEVGIKRNFKFIWNVLFLEKNEIVSKILNNGQFWVVTKQLLNYFLNFLNHL